MPIDRFFTEGAFQKGSQITLDGPEFHHLSRVTRTKEGEKVELVNGQGQLAHALVERLEKREASLMLQEVLEPPPPRFNPILAQAIPRLNRLDFIVEKGTELGMKDLWLFPSEKSEKKELTEKQLSRLKSVSIAAMKQCGRLILPRIILMPSLPNWETFPSPAYFGDIESTAPTLYEAWKNDPPSDQLAFFIGPESGFTEKEVERLKSQGVQGVSMHENILRTDTASLCALALVNHFALAADKMACEP